MLLIKWFGPSISKIGIKWFAPIDEYFWCNNDKTCEIFINFNGNTNIKMVLSSQWLFQNQHRLTFAPAIV